MSSLHLLRLATARVSPVRASVLRWNNGVVGRSAIVQPAIVGRTAIAGRTATAMKSRIGCMAFSTSGRKCSGDHAEESFEEFTARYEKEFEAVQDVFELQRNLNNAFAYDLVPSTSVINAALRAARRVNDFPTAVRIFEGIKAKVENQKQYEEYLQETKSLREELGVNLKEDLYPA